ncbi:hypothetical protein CUJ84_Chr004169 [Rhizobium leguminosarum]|uniref:Uncharacterized protein n=1 Tax=Rhizobium leguminosarum TaxID=384 RepID=A0A2K9Z8E7_RHILE|nr:hypothetical protein CUJ84_Chr004169 [Rhizobium leguminosarum]
MNQIARPTALILILLVATLP